MLQAVSDMNVLWFIEKLKKDKGNSSISVFESNKSMETTKVNAKNQNLGKHINYKEKQKEQQKS